MKKNVILSVAGGVLVIGVAVVAYLKRETVKQAVPVIIDQIKRRLPKTQPGAPNQNLAPEVED